jgi:hypothetical protein
MNIDKKESICMVWNASTNIAERYILNETMRCPDDFNCPSLVFDFPDPTIILSLHRHITVLNG